MNKRIAILCNDRLALPATSALLASGTVVAVAMPATSQELRPIVERMCTEAGIPFRLFHKRDLGREMVLWLSAHTPDVVLVKTFPWRIPAAVLALPAHGFINFHYAPLPAWRGPNPIFWMVRNRAATAGVTVHRMEETFDTGPVLLQLPVPVQPDMTFGVLYTQLAYAGLDATSLLLQGLSAGTLKAVPQQHHLAGWFRRPVPADLVIDWQGMTAAEVQALVKACNPWNKGAATSWNGWTFGITDATIITTGNYGSEETPGPGTVVALNDTQGLLIACKDGYLVRADIVYCEEGFFAGHRLTAFGLKKHDRLGLNITMPAVPAPVQEETLL
jgi:methionyl-tRNA formyltransferase